MLVTETIKMMNIFIRSILLLTVVVTFSGCSFLDFFRKPERPPILKGVKAWREAPEVKYLIPPQAFKLRRLKICLSPGHGGDSMLKGYKAGPTGVREADANLRIALYLRELLEAAGATVFMTREDDYYINLPDRCKIANANDVDIYIALHHNAVDNGPSVNQCGVYYHATPDEAIQSLDLARNLQREINNALRLPQLPSIPLHSDYSIYPDWGFGEIRAVEAPAVALSESSFHSNPEEEQKLDTLEYNRREAYGYFMGIVDYVYDGIPKATLTQPAPGSKIDNKQPQIKITLLDGWSQANLIIPSTIRLLIDGKLVQHTFNQKQRLISYTPEQPLKNNYHTVQLIASNLLKNSCRYNKYFQVAPPAEKLTVQCYPNIIPANSNSMGLIKISAFDRDGEPVADGMRLNLAAQYGTLESDVVFTRGGCAWTYLYPDTVTTTTTDITASYDQITSTCQAAFDISITQPSDLYDAYKMFVDTTPGSSDLPIFIPRLSLPVDSIVDQQQLYGSKESDQFTRKNAIFSVLGMTPVKAAAGGEIVAADSSGEVNDTYPFPNYVLIKHRFKFAGQDVYTMYANLCQIDVKIGDIVARGQIIGSVGKELVRCDVENNLLFEVRVGDNNPDSGRNPDLWLESKRRNNGIIIGRLNQSSDGSYYPGLLIEGASKYPELIRYENTVSYTSDIKPDEIFQENFVIADVAAGDQKLTAKIGKTPYTKRVDVEHGKISIVSWDIP